MTSRDRPELAKDAENEVVDSIGRVVVQTPEGPREFAIGRPDWSKAVGEHESGVKVDPHPDRKRKHRKKKASDADRGKLAFVIFGESKGPLF